MRLKSKIIITIVTIMMAGSAIANPCIKPVPSLKCGCEMTKCIKDCHTSQPKCKPPAHHKSKPHRSVLDFTKRPGYRSDDHQCDGVIPSKECDQGSHQECKDRCALTFKKCFCKQDANKCMLICQHQCGCVSMHMSLKSTCGIDTKYFRVLIWNPPGGTPAKVNPDKSIAFTCDIPKGTKLMVHLPSDNCKEICKAKAKHKDCLQLCQTGMLALSRWTPAKNNSEIQVQCGH